MNTISFDGLTLFYKPNEAETAELVRQACAKSLQINQHLWGFTTPEECQIYILDSNWLRTLFQAAPWTWRIPMGLLLPFWYYRTLRLWRIAAGWAQSFGKRRFIGIKPPRLIQLSDRSIGSRIFTHTDDLSAKVQHTTCHELTHACAAHLKLPAWLNEGLAMFTVDHFAGEPTVQENTLEILRRSSGGKSTTSYRRVNYQDQEAVIYLCVRGYWITRYLQDTQPEMLKSLFGQRFSPPELENKLASALGMSRESFWNQIDQMITSHF